MNRALIFIFLLLTSVFGSVLARLNFEPVNLHYYFGSAEIPLALLLVMVLVCGALMGLLMTLSMILSARIGNRRLRRQLQLREQEIRNLRDIPIKGRH
jgi:putative membrane protein